MNKKPVECNQCGGKHFALGLCMKHYKQQYARGAVHKTAMTRWWKNNPEKQKMYNVKRKYGLDPYDYINMDFNQMGQCANEACSNPLAVVDHCHRTGVVRGLLCRQCNTSIGQVGDCVDKLLGLVAYLTK
mgnify:CR=1 FL=1